MSGLALGVVVLVLAQASVPPAQTGRTPVAPGLSWEEAEVVARTLRRIDRRLRSGRPASKGPVVVTEGQINSFVNLSLADKLPPEVSGFALRLEKGRVAASATVDLDRLRTKLPEGGAPMFLSLLSGLVPVELRGRLQGARGMGRFELEEARIGGVSVPPSALAQMVSLATRDDENPSGVDIAAPMELPWTARTVRVEPGRLLVGF